jgi:hypothetical protein
MARQISAMKILNVFVRISKPEILMHCHVDLQRAPQYEIDI